MKILFIGCGKMGGAIFKSLVSYNETIYDQITIVDPNEENINIPNDQRIKKFKSVDLINQDDFNIIILAIKPQNLIMLKGLKFKENVIILSIMAIKNCQQIEELFTSCKICRVMPNMGATFGASFSLVYFHKEEKFKLEEKNYILKLVKTFGSFLEIKESLFDLGTIGASCMPAFIYLFSLKMAEALNQSGLDLKLSREIVKQSIISSAKILENNTGQELEDVIESIASKGGMTEIGLDIINKSDIKQICSSIVNNILNKKYE